MKYICEQCNEIFDNPTDARSHERRCQLINTIRTAFAEKFENRRAEDLSLQNIKLWPDHMIREFIEVIETVYKPAQLNDLFTALWPDFSHLKK